MTGEQANSQNRPAAWRRLLRWDWWERHYARPKVRRWVLYLALAAFLLLGAKYYYKVNKGKTALLRWLPQIVELRQGVDIFSPDTYIYPHPPFAAVCLISYTLVPVKVAAGIWYISKWAVFLLSLALIFDTIEETGYRFSPFAKVVVFLLTSRAAWGDIEHGNINLFILFWCVAALWAFRHRLDALCGLCLAVGISLKVTPALLWVYFAYKRSWRVCGWTLAGMILFSLVVPSLVFGFGETLTYSRSWYEGMVQPHIVEAQVDVSSTNQSLHAVLMRFITPGDSRLGRPLNFLSLSPQAARWVLRGVLFAFLLLLAWLCRTPAEGRENNFLALEYSLILLAMLYLNERSWKHHYVLLAYPFAVWIYVIRRATRAGAGQRLINPRRWTAFLLLVAAMIYLPAPGLAGRTLSRYAEWYGSIFFASLILFIGIAVLVVRARRNGWTRFSQALEEQPVSQTESGPSS